LGTFGTAAAFSFHETKNIGCGEGGALTLGDPALLERAQQLRDKGTNRQAFEGGLVDKYTWVDVGSSYALSDLNAAYLAAQLAAVDRIQARRAEIIQRYQRALGANIERAGAYSIRCPKQNQPNHHLFAIVFHAGDARDRFIAHMRRHQIITPFHYVALHLSPMGKAFHDGAPLPNSERLTRCLVRLPVHFNLTDAEQDEVIGRAAEFLHAL